MSSHVAWHVIEFHRVAFLEELSFKSGRFSIAEMKYALLTSFPHFHSHKDNCTSHKLPLNLSEIVVFSDEFRSFL